MRFSKQQTLFSHSLEMQQLYSLQVWPKKQIQGKITREGLETQIKSNKLHFRNQ